MVRHVNVGLIRFHVFSAIDVDPSENAPRYEPAPPTRAPVLHFARPVKRPQQQRDCSHHHCMRVPQQIGEGRPKINKNGLEFGQVLTNAFPLLAAQAVRRGTKR